MSRAGAKDATQKAGFGVCRLCGRTPFGESELCRSCARRRNFKTAARILIGLELAAGMVLAGPHLQKLSMPGVPALGHLSTASAGTTRGWHPASVNSAWFTFDTGSAFGSGVVHHATLISNDPPAIANGIFTGATKGRMELALSRTAGNVINVIFDQVKSACRKVQCTVRTVFDQTQPEIYPASDQSTRTATILSIGNIDRFLQRLSVSHELMMVASLGTKDDHVLSFSVAGYQTATRDHPARIMLTVRERPAGQPFPG